MNDNTMQLITVPMVNEEIELPMRRRGFLRSTGAGGGKHRVHDRVRQLESELRDSQRLNISLSENLSAQIEEFVEMRSERDGLLAQIRVLQEKLRHSDEACYANNARVDFDLDQVSTYDGLHLTPIEPVMEPLRLIPPPDATDVMLARIIPHDEWGDLDETYDDTMRAWRAKRPNNSQAMNALSTDQSSTGTFTVTNIGASPFAGDTPTTIPTLSSTCLDDELCTKSDPCSVCEPDDEG